MSPDTDLAQVGSHGFGVGFLVPVTAWAKGRWSGPRKRVGILRLPALL
jgi:hypothetical protein